MSRKILLHAILVSILSAGLLLTFVLLIDPVNTLAMPSTDVHYRSVLHPPLQTTTVTTVYLPLILKRYPWRSPFGVESNLLLQTGTSLLTRTEDLGVNWVRLNGRISWRALQPDEGSSIQWHLLEDFEDELRALEQANLTPVVIIDDYPRWATINDVRNDNQPTSCGPLRSERFDEFAQFVRAIVARYKQPEFNVYHWELGNEPDVDPDLVNLDSIFGCWGNIDDTYYGGEYYGEMLKVVGAAIKKEDPRAKVWIGGLLLDVPNTEDPNAGKPERFLEGILESGAAPYFDIVPYHSYPSYRGERIDYDNATGGPWDAWGGGYVGKALYLRQIMDQYDLEKPVFLNETGLLCPSYYSWCNPPDEQFYQMQADYVVRSFVRATSKDIMGVIWYTINGPGWRHGGLLDSNDDPKPVYYAYQHLNSRLQGMEYVGYVDYGDGIEAYAYSGGAEYVHVVWAREAQTITLDIPEADFVATYDRDGNLIEPTLVDSVYKLNVGFEPIYVIRYF